MIVATMINTFTFKILIFGFHLCRYTTRKLGELKNSSKFYHLNKRQIEFNRMTSQWMHVWIWFESLASFSVKWSKQTLDNWRKNFCRKIHSNQLDIRTLVRAPCSSPIGRSGFCRGTSPTSPSQTLTFNPFCSAGYHRSVSVSRD